MPHFHFWVYSLLLPLVQKVIPARNLRTLVKSHMEQEEIGPAQNGSRLWGEFHAEFLVVRTAALQRRTRRVARTGARRLPAFALARLTSTTETILSV